MILLYRGEDFDPNFYYHSGVDIDHSFLLLSGNKKTLFTSRMNQSIARATFKGEVITYQNALETLAGYLKKRTGKAVVGFDGASMSANLMTRLGKICKLADQSEELMRIRMKKRIGEVRATARAVKATKEIFELLDFKSAKTELGLEKQLKHATIDMGLDEAFAPIVATDKNTSYPHYTAKNKKLGGLVLVDYGVKYGHYCADLTRCFILDKDKKKLGQYEKLQGICHEIVDRLPELETGKDVAQLSAKLVAKAKFPKMIHSIGHGVGLEIHELPRLGMKSKDKIGGALLAIEPAFYLTQYGMRFEETAYFNGKKGKIL